MQRLCQRAVGRVLRHQFAAIAASAGLDEVPRMLEAPSLWIPRSLMNEQCRLRVDKQGMKRADAKI